MNKNELFIKQLKVVRKYIDNIIVETAIQLKLPTNGSWFSHTRIDNNRYILLYVYGDDVSNLRSRFIRVTIPDDILPKTMQGKM